MRVLLCQLDGKLPNLALMRIGSHHRALGDERIIVHGAQFRVGLWGYNPDRVYASAIFRKTESLVTDLRREYPNAIIGGTGYDLRVKVEDYGVTTHDLDYSLYPRFPHSIGFTQRGCRLACEFCVVPKKEGRVKPESTISEIWRGDPWPKNVLLLDNDFFGQPRWRDRIAEIRDGGFKVCFNQGINARCLTEEAAEAIASVDYRDDSFSRKRIYTAWDSRGDHATLFKGLNRLVKYGVQPDHIMVFMLIGYWPGETHQDRNYRRRYLRRFGARPYPMPYVRTPELIGFQRWVVGAYDKRIGWNAWERAKYQPANLGFDTGQKELPL